MQDSNTENTIPNRPDRGTEETVPVRAQPIPDEPVETAVVSEPLSSGETVATPINTGSPKTKKKRTGPRRWPWVLAGILMVILFSGAGGWIGYRSALQLRKNQVEEQRVGVAKEHFMAGLVAQQNKQYEVAQQQFEFVIRTDPSFPGAQDKLREVLIAMSIDRTPTIAPVIVTPTVTPTLDTRPQEEIYAQAKQQYAAQDWAGFFTTVDALRRIDPNYQTIDIDGMMYIALRFRGTTKILQEANLEGGLYDLALAERFAPLDNEALGYRNWARQYLTGASFWEVDWQKVLAYFEEIYPSLPNMRDSSGWTAIERYRIAASSYADELMAGGDSCGAYDYYQKSLNAVADSAVQTKADEAYRICYPPTTEPTVTPAVTVTPTVGEGVTPEVSPTVEPTTETPPPAEPTAEPTPTDTPTS